MWPSSPLLLEYGEGFAAFVDAFEPAGGLPYLGDVARLEWARQQAYHAADAEPLQPQHFERIDPENLADLRLVLHPSAQLCESRWPVLDVWATNARDAQVRSVDLAAGGQQLLILRPHAQVVERLLPDGGMQFLREIRAGRSLAECAGSAMAGAAHFDLAGLLQLMLQVGALIDVEPVEQPGGGIHHV